MEPDRSELVAARVVAWHNRHPLARRIRPEQVHSIGVVSLPFAIDGATEPAPELPVLEEAVPAAEALPPEPAARAEPAEPGVAPPADPPTMPEVVIDDFDDDDVARANAESSAEPPVSPEAPAEATPDDEPATVTLVAEPSAAPSTEPSVAPAPEAAASEPEPTVPEPTRWRSLQPPARDPRRDPGPPAWHPRRWWPGSRAAVRSLFSEDFIEPLSPRRVARWVAAHGSFKRPLGADAPERQVLLDEQRLVADGAPGPVALHVLTAAIGADGRRVRLLISPTPQGPILGPHQWDRRRVGAAGAGLALAFGAALSPRYWPLPDMPQTLTQASSPVASAASAASAVGRHAAPAESGERTETAHAAHAASAASTPADAVEVAQGPAVDSASAPAADTPPAAHAAASAKDTEPPHAVAQAGHAAEPAAATGHTPAPATPSPGRPVDVEPRLGRIDLPPIIADLPRESRSAAVKPPSVAPEPPKGVATHRAAAPELAAKAPADGGHRYALVMRATRTRAESEALAWRLRQHAGAAAGNSRADLLQTGDRWRAILFPFADARGAEKARQALVARGLAVELVEF